MYVNIYMYAYICMQIICLLIKHFSNITTSDNTIFFVSFFIYTDVHFSFMYRIIGLYNYGVTRPIYEIVGLSHFNSTPYSSHVTYIHFM